MNLQQTLRLKIKKKQLQKKVKNILVAVRGRKNRSDRNQIKQLEKVEMAFYRAGLRQLLTFDEFMKEVSLEATNQHYAQFR